MMAGAKAADPIVIAHRGASGYLPEHTLAAKAAAHAMGADYIEQDVVLSRDGVPVVLHDIYLDSTTDVARCFPGRARADGRYYALDFDLDEIRQLRAHERVMQGAEGSPVTNYPRRFPGDIAMFRVPTLAEEIDLISGMNASRERTTGLYVEFKAPNWHRAQGHDLVAAVMSVLQDKEYADRPQQVFLQCFDDRTLRRLRHELKTPLPLIQLIAENDWGEDSAVDYDYLQTQEGLADVASYADGIGPWIRQVYLGMDESGATELSELVNHAHEKGLVVHPYTFRSDELPEGVTSFDRLLDIFLQQAQVDGLFTDFPDKARQYIDRQRQIALQ
jgi:glycerophosphoryl diester phosphodiesterase